MLEQLHIQNYRLFKDLKIEKLGRVNLIAGKNNCGKTALLEAIRILASDGDATVINNICFNRGHFTENREVSTYGSLFFKQEYGDLMGDHIQIVINELVLELAVIARPFYALIVSHNWTTNKYEHEILVTTSKGFKNPNDKSVFLPLIVEHENNSKLWNEFVLTPNESDVLAIINKFIPQLSRISIIDNETKILLNGNEFPTPMKILGDGFNRLLTIALALVKSKYKILLLDEFEVGLHHSIQKQLWQIIFEYAKEWDIQVFVTTHSQDTVQAFAEVWNEANNENEGCYFRLERDRLNPELITTVHYDREILEVAYQNHIETR
jgi:AAA15 family ATPase/GTPase